MSLLCLTNKDSLKYFYPASSKESYTKDSVGLTVFIQSTWVAALQLL